MVESLPTIVDTHIKEQVKKKVPEQVRDQVPVYVVEGLILERQKTKEEMERMIAKAIVQERGNIHADISLQIQKAIDNHIPSQVDASIRSYMSGHISHVINHSITKTPSIPETTISTVPQTTCRTSVVRQELRDDPHDDAHTEGETRAKRQRDSKRDSRSSTTSLIKSRPFYLKKGSSGPEKIVLSLHKFPAIIFNDNDIEERTSRWVNKDLTNEEVEYLKLFEEEIEVRLKYRNQMRRWEMYVNGRPLGPRRERPE
ncbi:hypothetical protein Tco_0593993 [Tanacetum coccineum]